MRGLFALDGVLLLATCVVAQGISPVPNPPAATGTQVWIIDNGKIVEKMTDADFLRGEYARVGSTFVGEAFCRPQPSTPAPPSYDAPPPFAEPPTADVAPVEGESDLLKIILAVAGGVGGFFLGKKTADDDADNEEAEKPPAA